MKKLILLALALAAFAWPASDFLATSLAKVHPRAHASRVSAPNAAQLLAGNLGWYAAADDDLSAEWGYYERQGWDIVTMDLGAVPPASHDMRWWAYYKSRNGTFLWTKFAIRDPYATDDGSYRDWVVERTR